MNRTWIGSLLMVGMVVVLSVVGITSPIFAFEATPTPTASVIAPGGHDTHHGGDVLATVTPAPANAMDMSHMDHMATPVPLIDNMDMMDHTGNEGHDMGPIPSVDVPAATQVIGGQPLDYRLEDGVKVFELTAQPVRWPILDDVTVTAWTYNGTVPGPMIRVTEGDRVRIQFTNQLPEPTTIHWHGIEVPNAMDGVPGVTQDPVLPGETFTYEFVAKPAGSFMYHSHFESDTQVSIGLYAPFIIDPVQPENPPDVDLTFMLSEWRVTNGETYAAMPMMGMEPNYFTINGKAFPATETINVKVGQRVRLRLMGIGQFVHPMHLHGMPFRIVATDGYDVPEAAQLTKDTVSVAPGERYDIEFVATEPGQWMFHCHILHHTTNDGADPGGLMLIVNVTE
jgi:FtsP/CotA-like multicopper oxidase with cupredoxin domain